MQNNIQGGGGRKTGSRERKMERRKGRGTRGWEMREKEKRREEIIRIQTLSHLDKWIGEREPKFS